MIAKRPPKDLRPFAGILNALVFVLILYVAIGGFVLAWVNGT